MTPHGQNSLMMLMKSFDNVIFICMCNYLSKIVDDLREYFIIFNYNCFGSLIQNYIKKSNDKNKSKLLEYILDGSDIRMYNNELYRINLLHSDDINTLLQKMDLSVNIIYEKIVGRDKISDIDDVFNDVIDILREVETKTGICYNKIKLIIINKVIEKMYELNKVCIENKLDFIENVINN
jgi:DNA polymerase III delta prime subunit